MLTMDVVYSYDEVLKATTDYFGGDRLVADKFISKYCLKDKQDNYYDLTPDDLHRRLASEFSRIGVEKYGDVDRQEQFYDALKDFSRIVAQGSPMSAIGNPFQLMSASNCVVVPSPHDSMGGIMKTATQLAQLTKRRAGVGVDISTLRPDGFMVNNAAKTTTGAWSFADLFSYIIKMIGQKGRRGALMITLDVHHPDVIQFAKMKADLQKVTGANVSVRLSDEFLNAVENNEEYEQRWPCEGEAKFTRKVMAKDVWDTIVKYATETADPGLMFWSRIQDYNPVKPYVKTVCCNPCGEIPLQAFGSCRLISLNLTGFVRNAFEDSAHFDFDAFEQHVRIGQRMCDNLVDLEIELISKILDRCEDSGERFLWEQLAQSGEHLRRTGLGTHGLADMLAQLKIRYDSNGALEFVDRLYATLRDASYRESVELAKERGSFKLWDWNKEKDNAFILDLPKDIRKGIEAHGRRNAACNTNAPTGTVSLMSRCGEFRTHNISSGIEPVFRLKYTRRTKINPDDQNTRVDFVDETGEKWQAYEVRHGNLDFYFEKTGESDIPSYFVTSDQIDWQFRVELQGVMSRYIDHSISSTINLPQGTSSDLVSSIYMRAWKDGLKGITVYVDGSKSGVLVTNDSEASDRPSEITRVPAPKRPKELPCEIHHHSVKGQRWTAIVGLLSDEPYEMFGGYSEAISLPKKYKSGILVRRGSGKYSLKMGNGDDELVIKDVVGTFDTPELSWITRLVSAALRHGTPIDFMVEQLMKDGKINDFNRVLARVLKKYIRNGKVQSSVQCPECSSSNILWQEGCQSCGDCGYTKCG